MASENTLRVEVEIKASRLCFLSREPAFHMVLYLQLCDAQEPETFLEEGFAGVAGLLPLLSDRVIQCFDVESGEQMNVLRQEMQPSLRTIWPGPGRAWIQFTTSSALRADELPFNPSSLRPGRKYSLRFRELDFVTHWPASAEGSLKSLSGVSNVSPWPEDIPRPSKTEIPWKVIGENDVIFEARDAPPLTPKITVKLSAPSTYSLSGREPFKYTLTFTSDAPGPITVLAYRNDVHDLESDIEIIDPTTGALIAPDKIDICDEGQDKREDFITIDGSYTEHREISRSDTRWQYKWKEYLETLEIGKEYVLRSLGGWWRYWTDDTIDEVMRYLESPNNIGLHVNEEIRYEGGGEQRFRVVE